MPLRKPASRRFLPDVGRFELEDKAGPASPGIMALGSATESPASRSWAEILRLQFRFVLKIKSQHHFIKNNLRDSAALLTETTHWSAQMCLDIE